MKKNRTKQKTDDEIVLAVIVNKMVKLKTNSPLWKRFNNIHLKYHEKINNHRLNFPEK